MADLEQLNELHHLFATLFGKVVRGVKDIQV